MSSHNNKYIILNLKKTSFKSAYNYILFTLRTNEWTISALQYIKIWQQICNNDLLVTCDRKMFRTIILGQ